MPKLQNLPDGGKGMVIEREGCTVIIHEPKTTPKETEARLERIGQLLSRAYVRRQSEEDGEIT